MPFFHDDSSVLRAFDLADDIVPLAEESEPLIEHGFLLVIQVIPLGHAIPRLERRSSQSAGGILAGEDWVEAPRSVDLRQCTRPCDPVEARLTAILARRAVGRVAGHVEDGALDGDESWAIGIGAW